MEDWQEAIIERTFTSGAYTLMITPQGTITDPVVVQLLVGGANAGNITFPDIAAVKKTFNEIGLLL